MRNRKIGLVFNCLFIILVIGLVYLQVIKGDHYYNLSISNSIRGISIEAARGKILDRRGVILADTVPSFQISIVPHEASDKEKVFQEISRVMKLPVDDIKDSYRRNYRSPYYPVGLISGCSKDEIIAIEERRFSLPGIIVDVHPKRFYPFRNTCSHFLGYLGQIDSFRMTRLKPYGYSSQDFIGKGGIEERYDLILRGEKGGVQVEVDNKGRRIRTVGYKPPSPGRDIELTIDMRVQKIIDELMRDRRGAVILMDPDNGQIIALNSSPDFDPNKFIDRDNINLRKLLEDSADSSPLFNRAVFGRYPPGSVFKLVSAVAIMENQPYFFNKSFKCGGELEIGGRTFRCSAVHGEENLYDAIIHSCNVYFYRLGLLMGPNQIVKYAHKVGLGKKTGVDINYEPSGFIPSPSWKKLMRFQNWYRGDTANFVIGQGDVLAAPLQIVRLVSIFANGGNLVRPHLIKAVDGQDIAIPETIHLNLRKETLDFIDRALYGAVNDQEGTASVLKMDECKVYGKTGTAQTGEGDPHGWFAGYFGKDKPKYSICVFLENVGSSQFACLLTRRIIDMMLEEGLI